MSLAIANRESAGNWMDQILTLPIANTPILNTGSCVVCCVFELCYVLTPIELMSMAGNFRETLLKLLSETNYSLDNLSLNQISSFENLTHLKPLFEWFSHNITEANCIIPEELEEFTKLQASGIVKYGDDLEEAIQAHLCKDADSSVPFKESLNDAEQELTLLKEQLQYKQALYQSLCSSNALAEEDIREIKKKQQRAEANQKEVIREICSANKTLKDSLSGLEATANEMREDIIGLAPNAESPDVSSDEGIDSLTSENTNLNKSLSTSLCSLATTSSWQTIKGKDGNTKYMCQLSFEKYQMMHKIFVKRLQKILDNLSKAGWSQSLNLDRQALHIIKDRLEKQMYNLIEKEAELEAVRAARSKVHELLKTKLSDEDLLARLNQEEQEIENGLEHAESLKLNEEELHSACKQWAEYEALQAEECKMRDRIEHYKQCLVKMDKLLNPLMLKFSTDRILLEVLQFEKERIEKSIDIYNSFHKSLRNQVYQIKRRIELMQNNLQDFKSYCGLPLEERSDQMERLASIMMSHKEDVVQTVHHLTDTSRADHEIIYQHFVEEKNKLVSSGKIVEDTATSVSHHTNSGTGRSEEIISSIQRALDQMDCTMEEVNGDIREVIQYFSFENKENMEEFSNRID